MKRVRGIRRGAVLLTAILMCMGLVATGCSFAAKAGSRVAVRAVARGVPTASPFFKEGLKLGLDLLGGEALDALAGGVKKGNQEGLYGGTRNKSSCDKGKLIDFLLRPENRKKALAWADAQGIDLNMIKGFVKDLTPVLLRNDTLVKNHDYSSKKGRATVFDALLEAGIAVLVDLHGQPVVQCSCGNPLGAFEHQVDEADVKFEGRVKKWTSYDSGKSVKVDPTPKEDKVDTYVLVDVENPDKGVEREAGSEGGADKSVPIEPSNGTVDVPDVAGKSPEEAQQILEAAGFTVLVTDGVSDTAEQGTVFDQSPAAGEPAEQGSQVTVTVATDGTAEPTDTTPSSTPSDTSTAGSGGPSGEVTGTPTDGVTTPGADGGGTNGGGTNGGEFFGGTTP